MAQRVRAYIETTVVSYLVARPTRDLITASRHETTRLWWNTKLNLYDPCISQVVIQEISEGDAEMVEKRLEAARDFPSLDPNTKIDEAIAKIAAAKVLPAKALGDLAHLTFAAVHEVPLLVTWNFRHLANRDMLFQLRRVFGTHGLTMPEVFTPEQLLIAG